VYYLTIYHLLVFVIQTRVLCVIGPHVNQDCVPGSSVNKTLRIEIICEKAILKN
jgi:hypothetical protein